MRRKRKEKPIKIEPIQLQKELENLCELVLQIPDSSEACDARMATERLLEKWNSFLEQATPKILEILENNTTRGHRLDVGRIHRDRFEKVAKEILCLIDEQPLKSVVADETIKNPTVSCGRFG